MLVSNRSPIFIFVLILQLLDTSYSERKEKRGIRKPRKGVFQVLNQPKGGRAISKPIPKLAPPPPPVAPAAPPRRLSPLLDFPEYEDTPLLDFPDPLDAELRRKFGGYNKACDVAANDKRKLNAKRRKRLGYEDIVHETQTQNRRLKQALVTNAIDFTPIPDHNPVFGFKLLNMSSQIFQAICPDKYVPTHFINNAVYAFTKLHLLTSADRSEYLDKPQFDWISSALDACSNGSKNIQFFVDEPCKEEVRAWKNKRNWLCSPWKEDFNPRIMDPLLDIIWHIYNFVHSYCFPQFKDMFQMLHSYGAAITDLFSGPVRQRWLFQVEGNITQHDKEFWDMILGPNHQFYFKNIERCTQAAAELNLKGVRIPRFVIGGSIRYKASDSSNPYPQPG